MADRSGDTDRIISTFEMYEKKLYHIAYAILADTWQAEDAVMDAFVRLLEKRYRITDPSSDSTKRLIIKLVRSAAIDIYRKNQADRERQTLAEDPAALDLSPGSELELPGEDLDEMLAGL